MKLNRSSDTHKNNSDFNVRKLKYDFVCALIVCILPYLFLIHLLFDKQDKKLQIFGETIFHSYPSNMTMIWFLTTYLSAALLLTFFFWNTRAMWRYFLLPIILVEFASFLNVIYSSMNYYQLLLSYQGLCWLLTLTIAILVLDFYCFRPYARVTIKMGAKELLKAFDQQKINRVISKAQESIASKKKFSVKKYLYQIYHIRTLIETNELKYAQNRMQNSLLLNLSFGLGIMLISLLLFSDTFFPIKSKYVDVFGIRIYSFGFKDIESLLWYGSRKMVMILLMIFWLYDSKHWWKWVILSPIVLYSYQFWEIFTNDLVVEGISNMVLIPLVVATVASIVVIINFLRKNNIAKEIKEILNLELEESIAAITNSRNEN